MTVRTSRLLALLALASLPAWAQMTPVGRWHTIDDETKEVKSEVVITEKDGVLTGRIEKLLRKGADPNRRCTACTDDRKDQPFIGLEIIRGVKPVEGRAVWEGGTILDPESGKTYNVRLTPVEGGAKLEVRGSILFIGRTQTWVRAN
ncbi:hypothetical protein Tther_01856 [Tepidimonas thermarum]|uniref:DUF2147 domain-containing protein n=1 Tax=Tepidimonas thermarum TaxID=335431 RepID=A0A554WYY1_9BURK|nr:DUF2147 domain-containing protein [Tepidimonas thermarum]TSE28782.1 hypothetical protein Tther_01856 [Tepidimonas thermarum]